jgi:hypothetical protein
VFVVSVGRLEAQAPGNCFTSIFVCHAPYLQRSSITIAQTSASPLHTSVEMHIRRANGDSERVSWACRAQCLWTPPDLCCSLTNVKTITVSRICFSGTNPRLVIFYATPQLQNISKDGGTHAVEPLRQSIDIQGDPALAIQVASTRNLNTFNHIDSYPISQAPQSSQSCFCRRMIHAI